MNNDDLLYTNQFINPVSKHKENVLESQRRKSHFKNFIEQKQRDYDKEQKIEQSRSVISMPQMNKNNLVMVDDPLYTNKVDCGHKQQIKKKPERYYKERVTMVNIDSRHRDTSLYEYQNHYKISLPRTFSNIKSIQFKSSEFVNTQNTIRALPTSKANNKIHWYVKDENFTDASGNALPEDQSVLDRENNQVGINKYVATIPTGSYTASTLASTIQHEMNDIRRSRTLINSDLTTSKITPYNNFEVLIDDITNEVSFDSFESSLLSNPFSVDVSTNIINVSHTGHGYSSGTKVRIMNATKLGGIPKQYINTDHVITVGNTNAYSFSVSGVTATSTASLGGGDTVEIKKEVPVKLLFSESNSIGTTVGFNATDTDYSGIHRNNISKSSINIDYSLPTNPMTFVTKTAHGLKDGDRVFITGHGGSPVDSLVNSNDGYIASIPSSIGADDDGYAIISDPDQTKTFTIPVDGDNNTDAFDDEVYATINTTGAISSFVVTNGGSDYTSAPTVVITDSSASSTASGTATLGLTSLTITNQGTGYTSAPTVTVAGGSGFTTDITFGDISAVSVTNGGSGYTTIPTVTLQEQDDSGTYINADTYFAQQKLINTTTSYRVASISLSIDAETISGATLIDGGCGHTGNVKAVITHDTGVDGELAFTVNQGKITSISVTSSGSGFTSATPSVTFSGGGGNNLAANALCDKVGGITLVGGGAGYTSDVAVSFTGGGGSGATATARFNSLTGFTISGNAGVYGTAPNVHILSETELRTRSSGSGNYSSFEPDEFAQAVALLSPVESITVVTQGTFFTQVPTITITTHTLDNTGSGATATAVLETDPGNSSYKRIASITVTDKGSGYTAIPTITITPHESDTNAYGYLARAVINTGSISKINISNPGSNYKSIPKVELRGKNGSVQQREIMRPVNLSNEKYLLVTSDLGTAIEDGNVSNILGKIQLAGSLNDTLYNTFIAPALVFEDLKDNVSEIEFMIKSGDNELFEFNDVEHSFTLEITEYIDLVEGFGQSTKRGAYDET